ncbi:hypothetical protein NL676_016173 [Syzygium grande]|nr:hypothetical protein NL676_016173 [Syzygium grande]
MRGQPCLESVDDQAQELVDLHPVRRSLRPAIRTSLKTWKRLVRESRVSCAKVPRKQGEPIALGDLFAGNYLGGSGGESDTGQEVHRQTPATVVNEVVRMAEEDWGCP